VRKEPLVRVVLPEEEPMLGARCEHPVRFLGPFHD
jgi:hypothetical protein